MKTVALVLLSLFPIAGFSQSENPKYDPTVAKTLGSDDYGMKYYIMVILKSGTASVADDDRARLFSGHMQNLKKMAADGKLSLAGPMQQNSRSYAGIFILNVKTEEEAKELLKNDPAIAAGLLEPEFFVWYGTAALQLINGLHDTVKKKDF